MPEQRVEIIDREGWRKEQALDKMIVHIGSDPRNDIVLETWRGGGVAARHAQVIAVPGIAGRYRLVNLADTDIVLGESQERVLAPRASIDVDYGERIRVGDFTLILRGDDAGASGVAGAGSSGSIGLRLFLPHTDLSPSHPLDGYVTVRNLGTRTGVQFKLEVQGWEPEDYEMGAGPILFPHAEKEVYLHLHHPRRPKPAAGNHTLTIRATAPEAYPGDSATISQVVRILPYFAHSVRLIDQG